MLTAVMAAHPTLRAVVERINEATTLASVPGVIGWAAVDLTAPSDPLATLVQYGVLGLVVLAFITGWIVPGPQAKQLIEENKRLNQLIETRLLPMSEQYAASQEKTAIVMDKCTVALERAITVLQLTERDRGQNATARDLRDERDNRGDRGGR